MLARFFEVYSGPVEQNEPVLVTSSSSS